MSDDVDDKETIQEKKKFAEEEITVGAREKPIEWMALIKRFMKAIRCTRLNDVSCLSLRDTDQFFVHFDRPSRYETGEEEEQQEEKGKSCFLMSLR